MDVYALVGAHLVPKPFIMRLLIAAVVLVTKPAQAALQLNSGRSGTCPLVNQTDPDIDEDGALDDGVMLMQVDHKLRHRLKLRSPLTSSMVVSQRETDSGGNSAKANKPYFWSGKNGDLLRTGASPYVGPSRADIQKGPAWSYIDDDVVRATPLIDDDMNIYVASVGGKGGTIPVPTGKVLKMDAFGNHLWTFTPPGSIPSVPALLNGALFMQTTMGDVFGIRIDDGSVLWRTRISNQTAGDTGSMTVGNGIVVAATLFGDRGGIDGGNDRLVALNTADGSVKWTFAPDHQVYNLLAAIRDGRLVFSDKTGVAYCLNLTDGALVWKTTKDDAYGDGFSTGGAVMGGKNGNVYVTANILDNNVSRGQVSAYSFQDGSPIWHRWTAYAANNAPAVGQLNGGGVGNFSLVIGVGDNPDLPLNGESANKGQEKKAKIETFDAETGTPGWSFDMPLWHGAVVGDTVLPLHICLPDCFGNAAIGGDGTVYIGFEDGRFYSLRDANNDGIISKALGEVTSFDAGAGFQGSAAIAPGMLAVSPCNGMHVFKSDTSANADQPKI